MHQPKKPKMCSIDISNDCSNTKSENGWPTCIWGMRLKHSSIRLFPPEQLSPKSFWWSYLWSLVAISSGECSVLILTKLSGCYILSRDENALLKDTPFTYCFQFCFYSIGNSVSGSYWTSWPLSQGSSNFLSVYLLPILFFS